MIAIAKTIGAPLGMPAQERIARGILFVQEPRETKDIDFQPALTHITQVARSRGGAIQYSSPVQPYAYGPVVLLLDNHYNVHEFEYPVERLKSQQANIIAELIIAGKLKIRGFLEGNASLTKEEARAVQDSISKLIAQKENCELIAGRILIERGFQPIGFESVEDSSIISEFLGVDYIMAKLVGTMSDLQDVLGQERDKSKDQKQQAHLNYTLKNIRALLNPRGQNIETTRRLAREFGGAVYKFLSDLSIDTLFGGMDTYEFIHASGEAVKFKLPAFRFKDQNIAKDATKIKSLSTFVHYCKMLKERLMVQRDSGIAELLVNRFREDCRLLAIGAGHAEGIKDHLENHGVPVIIIDPSGGKIDTFSRKERAPFRADDAQEADLMERLTFTDALRDVIISQAKTLT